MTYAGPTGVMWTALALLLGTSVLILNGGPLYYFDSAGYYVQGNGILSFGSTTPIGLLGGEAATSVAGDGDVSISRSPIYAVLIAALWNAELLAFANLLNLLAVFVCSWLLARAAGRAHGISALTVLTSAPVAAASLGSLAFYIAYVMPDTFIGIAILLIACLSAYSLYMRPWEILLALAILAFALVVHRSHLLIAGLIIPFAVIGAILTAGRRGWFAGALVVAVVAFGVAEIKTYSFAAKTVAGKEATMSPFLTARVIEDGPGFTYLMEQCPNEANPSCPLAEALKISDDPFRLTAAHIAFAESRELGSFRLMTHEDQRQVAADQYGFFMRVFFYDPVGVTSAVVRNTLRQTGLVSVKMTSTGPGYDDDGARRHAPTKPTGRATGREHGLAACGGTDAFGDLRPVPCGDRRRGSGAYRGQSAVPRVCGAGCHRHLDQCLCLRRGFATSRALRRAGGLAAAFRRRTDGFACRSRAIVPDIRRTQRRIRTGEIMSRTDHQRHHAPPIGPRGFCPRCCRPC